MLTVVIPDPGLREYAGHHPAIIEAIANTKSHSNGEFRLSVFCHKECSSDLISRMRELGVSVVQHFSMNFYGEVSHANGYLEAAEYINTLTVEYINTLQENHGSGDLLYLFHTLDWQHAIALSSAISIVEKSNERKSKYVVCLMFDPSCISSTEKWDVPLTYSVAFRMLTKHDSVSVYASDYETRERYEKVVGKKINIHPCMLIGDETIPERHEKAEGIILHVGDAKPEKGFMDLPYLLRKYTSEIDSPSVEFIVQYSISNENEDLRDVERKIKCLAEKDDRIRVIDHFISQDDIGSLFLRSCRIIFNYDQDEYQNKSSGVLWLAVKNNLDMVFLTDNWLSREAKRLACILEGDQCSSFNSGGLKNHTCYYAKIFSNLGLWISSLGQFDHGAR